MSQPSSAQPTMEGTDNDAAAIASTLPSQKFQEFWKFPDLPLEIRFKIWKYNLPGPRTLVIASRENTNCQFVQPSDLQVRYRQAPVKVITTKVPPQLHTSREARQEAKRHYQLAFKDKLDGCPVWFDFSIDTLYISDNQAAKYFFEKFTIRPDQVNKLQWQLGEMRAQLRHIIFADEKIYSHSGDLLRKLNALQTAIFQGTGVTGPEMTHLTIRMETKSKQSRGQWIKFEYFLKGPPYPHSKTCKLKLIIMHKSSIEKLRDMGGMSGFLESSASTTA